jgi:hypothetical protein
MKRIICFVAGASISLAAVSGHGQSETFNYSGPINGQVDIGLNPGNGYSGGIESYFGNISETLYYNPSADTIQEVGTLTLGNSSGSFNMSKQGLIGGSPVGSGTVNVGNAGVVSFNTTFSANSSNPNYFSGVLDLPVSGSGTYNGQAFQANWNVDLPMLIDLENVTSGSLTFTQTTGNGGSVFGVPGSPIVDGLYDGYGGDNTIDYSWLQDPQSAIAVPDQTSSLALLGLAVASLAVFGRRFGASAGRL